MAKKKKRESIIESIIEGIQERKGEGITVVDLTGIEDTVCRYFVICQGGTPNQTLAIEDSIRELHPRAVYYARKRVRNVSLAGRVGKQRV